jgi:hypothetical protein
MAGNKRRVKYMPGARVCVSANAMGADRGKCGVIISERSVKTNHRGVPVDVAGAYKPVDTKKEYFIRTDSGELISVPKFWVDKKKVV